MGARKSTKEQSEPKTVGELLRNSAGSFGPKAALQIKRDDSYDVLTYTQLYEKSRNLSSFLVSSGIRKGDRVAILCENRPEWVSVYFGILGCGGVVVGIDTKLRTREIENILSHSEARMVFTSAQFSTFQFPQNTISVDEDRFKTVTGHTEEIDQARTDPNDLAMLVYTSGTTGAPKAVMLTHRNIVSNMLAAYRVLPARGADQFLSLLPLSHMFELVGGLLGPLYSGATVTYMTSMKASAVRVAMRETRTTIMLGVPLMFKLIYKRITDTVEESMQPVPIVFSFNMKMARTSKRFRIGRLLFRRIRREFGGHIRYFISGGASLEAEVEAAFRCMGMPILQGYGLTETSPIVTVNTLRAHRMNSVGRPLPGVTVRISEDGEIVVGGPGVMAGYYKDAESTSSVIKKGELYTGDIGFLDRDGFLYITGRKKNVIITAAGKNVYPEEIEVALARSPYVGEICVVGREHNGSESPFAFIIPDYDYFGRMGIARDDSSVRRTLRSEIENLSADLAEYKRVSDFMIFKGEFPKTTTRKVKRHELQQLADRKVSETQKEEVTDDSAKELRRLVARILEISEERISPDSDLYMDLGVDSLLKVEILSAIDRDFGISIPDELAYRLQSFRDIEELTKDYAKRRAPLHATLEENRTYHFLKERPLLRNFVKSCLFLFFRIFSKLYFSLEARNVENIRDLGSFIITPNHNSLLDVPIVLSSLPRETAEKMFSPAAKDYFFDRHPIRRWFIALVFDTFPFDRHGNFMKGLKKCKHTIEEGKSLILFPEGTRSMTGKLQPFKVGLGALAFDIGIPIVPTFIKGIHRAFGKGMLLPRPNKIEVRFGRPILMDSYKAKSGKLRNYEIYEEIIEDVKKEILTLM